MTVYSNNLESRKKEIKKIGATIELLGKRRNLFPNGARPSPNGSRFAGFSRELALEENLAKRVMGERRAKATMVSQHLRSGSRWEKSSRRAIFPIYFIHA